jgi:hypothetical protein
MGGKIIFNVSELQCIPPNITNTSWTGIRYVFDVDWTSNGNEYHSIDPTTNLELSMTIVEVATSTTVFSGVIDSSVPFITTGYQFDAYDYYPTFSDKYQITLTLSLTSVIACNESTSFIIPIDYT